MSDLRLHIQKTTSHSALGTLTNNTYAGANSASEQLIDSLLGITTVRRYEDLDCVEDKQDDSAFVSVRVVLDKPKINIFYESDELQKYLLSTISSIRLEIGISL